MTGMLRTRILDAMVSVVYEQGFADASVTAVCKRAKVSRQAFYEVFDGREECFLAVLQEGYEKTALLIASAFEQAQCWREGVRGALSELLLLFDSKPRLARVWLVESLAVGSWALERRERNVEALRRSIVERWPTLEDGSPSHPLAAVGVMASVLGVIQRHLLAASPEPLITLLGPLMGIVTAPYLDERAVAGEIARGEALAREMVAERYTGRLPATAVVVELPEVLQNPRARRARECVLYLAEHPGSSNRQVGSAIGVRGHAQISTLLARLAKMGLLHKRAASPGHSNEWSLTAYGQQVLEALERTHV